MVAFMIYYTFAVLALSLHGVSAGSGASVFGCVSLPDNTSAPLPFNVTFAPGSDNACMNSLGHGVIMSVTQPGLTCACIGYVEVKESGWCFFKQSHWSLEYSTQKYSNGAMSSRWSNTQGFFQGGHGDEINYLQVQLASKETLACNKEEICAEQRIFDYPGTYWKAGTTGPIFIIFRP